MKITLRRDCEKKQENGGRVVQPTFLSCYYKVGCGLHEKFVFSKLAIENNKKEILHHPSTQVHTRDKQQTYVRLTVCMS